LDQVRWLLLVQNAQKMNMNTLDWVSFSAMWTIFDKKTRTRTPCGLCEKIKP
jgi:hypothetical protein